MISSATISDELCVIQVGRIFHSIRDMPSKSKEEDQTTLSTFNIVRRAITPALGRLYNQAEFCFYTNDYLKPSCNREMRLLRANASWEKRD
jgi:hypothetical protein